MRIFERGTNGIAGGELRLEARGAPRRSEHSPAAALSGEQRDADRTLERLRRRRDLQELRPTAAKVHMSKVLVGERERRLYPLSPGEVDYIESRGNYVEFHVEDLVFISRDSIKRLSQALAQSGYVRIQRTLLLNVQAIVYAQRVGHGTYAFTLRSGARLSSGARYREEILRILPLTRARRLGSS